MKNIVFAITVSVCVSLISACSNETSEVNAGNSRGSPPATPVVVAPVRYDTFVEHIEALGTVMANESVIVTADVTGRITRINFEDGQSVAKGTVLIELDKAEEQASLAAAQANLTTQQTQYRRLLDLRRQKSVAQTTLDEQANVLKTAQAELEIARVRLQDRTIQAPFAGKMGIRRVSLGALVNPGTEIVTLDDLRVIKLDFSVPETFLAALQPGLDITSTSVAYPDRLFRGRVTVIGSRVDPVTRTVVVRGELPNPEGWLRAGMLLTVDLIKDRSRSLMIPEESLIPREERQYVYLVNARDQVEQVEVTIGRRRPGEAEVLTGVKAGDRVVVEGTTRLRPGMAVEIVARRDAAGDLLPDGETAGGARVSIAEPPIPTPSVR